MFLPLIQHPTPPKQWNCASPAPPARRTFPPYYPPLRPPVFGWLLHLNSSTGSHLRPRCVCFFFCRSICSPKQWDGVPPRAPHPTCLHSNTPPTAYADYQVDCCLKFPNSGYLRPEPGASLYFFVRPFLMLQSMEPAMARAHRTTCACFRPIGSGSAKI